MSNHFSADELKFPGDDRRVDLTDVFMFTSADDADKTVLIMDSNPTSAGNALRTEGGARPQRIHRSLPRRSRWSPSWSRIALSRSATGTAGSSA